MKSYEEALDEPREEDEVGKTEGSRKHRTKQKPTFHGDVLDGKTEDDGPDHAQGHLHVPIHNFYRKQWQDTLGGSQQDRHGFSACHTI